MEEARTGLAWRQESSEPDYADGVFFGTVGQIHILYFCLCFHLDSLHSEPGNPSAAQKRAHELRRLREKLSTTIQFLSQLRRAARGG